MVRSRLEKKQLKSKYFMSFSFFNIRNYLIEISNIQRREAKLNITLPSLNNPDIQFRY